MNADSRSIAEYLAQMSDELAQLARSSRLDLLAHLLSMARLEAEFLSGRRQ